MTTTRKRVLTAIACVLGMGLLTLVLVALPALAVSDTPPTLTPDRASADVHLEDGGSCTNRTASETADRLSDTDDATRPSLLSNDVLTHFVYLPLTLNCYGLCGACELHGQGGTEVITTTSSSCLATKIRIDLRKRVAGYGFSLFEVEAYGSDDPEMTNNLLIGGDCCASSVEGNNPIWGCDRAIDGSQSSRWSSDWYEPQWLVIVLPEPKVVKYVVLRWESAYATEYQVSVVGSNANCP